MGWYRLTRSFITNRRLVFVNCDTDNDDHSDCVLSKRLVCNSLIFAVGILCVNSGNTVFSNVDQTGSSRCSECRS